eukprot:gene11883-5210_t
MEKSHYTHVGVNAMFSTLKYVYNIKFPNMKNSCQKYLKDCVSTCLKSDNGGEFINTIVDSLKQIWDIDEDIPLLYAHDSKIERSNRDFKSQFHKRLQEKLKGNLKIWPDILTFVKTDYVFTVSSWVIAGSLMLAIGLCFGLFLIILGCAIWNNFWSIFAFLPFLFAPFPEIISRMLYTKDKEIKLFTGEDPDEASAAEHFLTFCSSFFLHVGFGILFILLHSQIIPWEAFIFVMSGCSFIYFLILIFNYIIQCSKNISSPYEEL